MKSSAKSTACARLGHFLRPALFAGALAVSAGILTACSSGKWGFPYRAPLQQGNWLTQEQVSLLRKGMTEEQVLYALGSPTLKDIFHPGRWDYPYYFKPGSGDPIQRNFSLWFVDGKLDRWGGDALPDYQPADFETQQSSGKDKERLERNKAFAGQPVSQATKEELQAQAVPLPEDIARAGTLSGPVGNSPAAIAPEDPRAQSRRGLPQNLNLQQSDRSERMNPPGMPQRMHRSSNVFQ